MGTKLKLLAFVKWSRLVLITNAAVTSALSMMSSPDRRTVNLPGRLGTAAASFSQETLGSGDPCATQGSSAWKPWMTESSVWTGAIMGGTERQEFDFHSLTQLRELLAQTVSITM